MLNNFICYNQTMQEKYIRARKLRNNMTDQEKKTLVLFKKKIY